MELSPEEAVRIAEEPLSLAETILKDQGFPVQGIIALRFRLLAQETSEPEFKCPYTFSHTYVWCGYDTCRDS